jgi:hypothetical protein
VVAQVAEGVAGTVQVVQHKVTFLQDRLWVATGRTKVAAMVVVVVEVVEANTAESVAHW